MAVLFMLVGLLAAVLVMPATLATQGDVNGATFEPQVSTTTTPEPSSTAPVMPRPTAE